MSYREEIDRLVQMPAYGLAHAQKADLYAKMLTAGTQYHREKCPEYGRFLRALGCPAGSFFCKEEISKESVSKKKIPLEKIPFLPVSIFKELDLKSIPDEQVFKVITSPGKSNRKMREHGHCDPRRKDRPG